MTLANRILLFAVALIAVIMLAVGYLVEGRLYERIIEERVTALAREARLLAAQWAAGEDPVELVATASSALSGRVTLVDSAGVIVADALPSGVTPQRVGTRARRPEIAQALARDLGVSIGVSELEESEELYVAVGTDRGVARVAVTTASLEAIFERTRFELATVWFAALAVAALLSLLYARYVSQPVIQLRDLAQALAARDFRSRPVSHAPGEVGDLAESLQELSVRLEVLERVRREFVANVSHELRTPLTIVSGYAATLAKESAASESQRKFAESIVANTARMQRIVDDLLDLSKVESGAWTPEIERVEIEPLVTELLDALQPAYAGAGVSLVLDFAPGADILNVDRTALRQVLANLVENGIRHSPAGTVTISTEQAPNGIIVSVRDTGEGIAPEHLPRIFERFYRVDSARARRSGGTGLGLAIVKHLAEAHGGRVEAISEPGVGTTIRAFFPAEPKRRPSPAAVSPLAATTVTATPPQAAAAPVEG